MRFVLRGCAAVPVRGGQLTGTLGRYQLGLFGESDEVVVAVHVIGGVLGRLAAADGVGKIQAENTAAQVELVLRSLKR